MDKQSQVVTALLDVAILVRMRPEIVKIRCESNDTWLCVDVWVHDNTFPPEMTEPKKLAIFLNTGAIYRVGEDGAVEEDPIELKDALKDVLT